MKAYFNLNIDDIHPEGSREYGDCGGDMDEGVFRYLNLLVDEFPKLKITLFTTPDWRYKSSPGKIRRRFDFLFGSGVKLWEEERFLLTNYPEWCKWLRAKTRSGNFEVGVHGLYHYQKDYPYSAEFANLSFDECVSRIKRAEGIFREAGIPFVKVFRAPGWGMNEELFKALSKLGYAVAGSADHITPISKNAVCNETGIRTSIIRPQKIAEYGITNIPQNWDPTRNSFERLEELRGIGALISAKVHICEWYGKERISNGLNKTVYENLSKSLRMAYDKFDFVFLSKFV